MHRLVRRADGADLGVTINTGRPWIGDEAIQPYGQYNLDEVQSAWGICFRTVGD